MNEQPNTSKTDEDFAAPASRAFWAGPLLPVFVCFVASLVLRAWMSRSLQVSPFWALQGACRDAMPGVALAALLYWVDTPGMRKSTLGLLMAFWAVIQLFLTVSDGIYFMQSGARLDRSLVENMSLTSLKPAETAPVLCGVAALALLLLALGWGTWAVSLRRRSFGRASWSFFLRAILCSAIAIGAVVPWARMLAFSPVGVSQERGNELLRTGQAETVAGIARTLWHTGPAWERPVQTYLSPEDRAWAVQHGLAPLPELSEADRRPRQPRWHRVVIVAVESLAGDFLDPLNPRHPKGMTPFLDSLRQRHPHLNNGYSVGVDTDEGQYSITCSRTDFEWTGHYYPGETLFSLARGVGFETCMMYGDTLHFRDHAGAYPLTFHVEGQFGKESFVGLRPAGDFCSWAGGLCDRAVLEEAVDWLEARRNKPVILLVDTLDTHPPYYWQKREAAFPKTVRESGSALAKALNQLDDNLRLFFDNLEACGLFDERTLVVVTADHFPTFGPEPLAMSGARGYATNRIPIIFVSKAPEAFRGLDEDRIGSQMDIGPTVAAQLGLAHANAFMGRDLLTPGPGRALGRERDLLRLRVENGPDQQVYLDDRGRPRNRSTPLARWYRWKLGEY